MPLITLILLPFIGSLIAAMLPANARNTESTLAGVIALGCAIQTALLFPQIADGEVLRQEIEWLPALGLNLVIRMDGFAWMFCMLVLGIGSLVVLYARYYMSPADPVPRFFSFFLAFMGAMAGVVLSGNIIQIAFFWELTSLFSFLLIGYWHHRKDARRGARMALTVTGTGGLAMLAGMLVLGHIVGSYDLDNVLIAGQQVRDHQLYLIALVLILLGALTKSAQFPFHFWLPHAMAAPTPVSAYLHSATMVKAGVFLLARMWPVLGDTDAWFWLVGGAGAATLLIGGYLAMFQHDLKGLLAYSTISHLGLITLLLGLNSKLAAVAAVFHIMNHATFKASLFMAAGIVDHESGTRDIRRLSGLRHMMPITATLACVASAAMAGVPLLNGFLSKEMFFAETVYLDAAPWVRTALPVAATVAGMFSVAYSLRFTIDVFFGPKATDLPHDPHEPPHWMRVPVELLVLACLVVGMLPAWAVGSFLAAAATPVVGGDLPVQPGHLARLEHALDHEPCGVDWRHPAVHAAALAAPGRPYGYRAAGGDAQRPACFREPAGPPVPAGPLVAPAPVHHAPAVADAVAGLHRRAGGRSAAVAARHQAWRPEHAAAVARLRDAVGRGHSLRPGYGLEGQVPPADGADHAGRRRAVHLPDLPVVLGA